MTDLKKGAKRRTHSQEVVQEVKHVKYYLGVAPEFMKQLNSANVFACNWISVLCTSWLLHSGAKKVPGLQKKQMLGNNERKEESWTYWNSVKNVSETCTRIKGVTLTVFTRLPGRFKEVIKAFRVSQNWILNQISPEPPKTLFPLHKMCVCLRQWALRRLSVRTGALKAKLAWYPFLKLWSNYDQSFDLL